VWSCAISAQARQLKGEEELAIEWHHLASEAERSDGDDSEIEVA
jgi:hypothetical protein